MGCQVMSFEMGLCVRCDLGYPVCFHSGLCSHIAGEFAWYVLLRNLLSLWCWLVSVQVWRVLDGLLLLKVPCSQQFSGVLRFFS